MRGLDSFHEKVRRWQNGFRKKFLMPPELLPVTVSVKESYVELVRGEGESIQKTWHMGQNEEESFRELGAMIQDALFQWGEENPPIRVLIPESWCFSLVAEMPAGLKGKELCEAGYWEMAGHLTDEGMEPEHFCIGVRPFDQEGRHACWLAAVPRERIETLKRALQASGREISYLGVHGEYELTLWQAKAKPWLARRLLLAGGVVLVLVLGFLTGMDLFELERAHADLELQKQVLAELDTDRRAMAMRQSIHARTREKTGKLSQLSQERAPGYSILIHLGTMNADGAWLDGIRMDKDDGLHLQGTAVNYAAVAGVLAAFEQDRDFFSDAPVMEEAKQASDGTIHFKMRIGGNGI